MLLMNKSRRSGRSIILRPQFPQPKLKSDLIYSFRGFTNFLCFINFLHHFCFKMCHLFWLFRKLPRTRKIFNSQKKLESEFLTTFWEIPKITKNLVYFEGSFQWHLHSFVKLCRVQNFHEDFPPKVEILSLTLNFAPHLKFRFYVKISTSFLEKILF